MDQQHRNSSPGRLANWQLWSLIAVVALAVVVTMYLTVRQMARAQQDASARPVAVAVLGDPVPGPIAGRRGAPVWGDPAAPPPPARTGTRAAG